MTINPRNRTREVLAVGPTVAIDLTIANNAAISEAFDMSDYCMGTVIVPCYLDRCKYRFQGL